MIDAVAPQDFAMTFAACAMIVLFGAGYAAFFAWSRIRGGNGFALAAGLCYVVLAGAIFVLGRVAHLDGHWRFVTALMLVGYLLAPYGIWRLCKGSHSVQDARPKTEG